jgi:hypothetical protein
MAFANLTAAQFLALAGAGSAFVLLLYLLDRSRRRQVVATLRFWTPADSPVEVRRWRIHQPLSLLLQLLALLLLLLAVAGMQTGGEEDAARDHVIVLDTSAWMAARSGGAGTWMEQARADALGYLAALPAVDRVMVFHAGSSVTPVTSFESDRQLIEEAIEAARPGAGAVNLSEAVDVAGRVLQLHGRRAGEVVFVGPGHTMGVDASVIPEVENLRFIQVQGKIENAGLVRVGLQHSLAVANEWEVFVAVRNQARQPRNLEVSAEFAGSPAVFRRLDMGPGEDRQFTFPLRTRAAGLLEVRILGEDGFPGDNAAVLEVPAREPLRVVVRSARPELLRPLFAASTLVDATYRRPDDPVADEADLLVLDGCPRPAGAAVVNTVWIRPPQQDSPVPVRNVANEVTVERWSIDHPVSNGLQTPDLIVARAMVFEPQNEVAVLATGPAGAVAVAREVGEPPVKEVILGFHPADTAMRNDLSAPLLFANIVRWMNPGLFQRWELNAGSAGLVTVPVAEELAPGDVTVADESGQELPFTLDDRLLRFYSGRAGAVTVQAGDRRIVCSLGLPPSPGGSWEPPDGVLKGVPPAAGGSGLPVNWWPWLALAGGICLLAEWLLYGQTRRPRRGASIPWKQVGKPR